MQVSVATQMLLRGIENCKLVVSCLNTFAHHKMITILPTGQLVLTLEARLEIELP